METLSPEEIVMLGTVIALELAKNKTKAELKTLRTIISQIYYSLSTLNK